MDTDPEPHLQHQSNLQTASSLTTCDFVSHCSGSPRCWLMRHAPAGTLPGIDGSLMKRSAPRGALLYSQHSWEELGGRFLGLMAYLRSKGR